MKRLITIITGVAIALPLMAQLNGDGFYRVQNAKSSKYATIVDNKADKDQLANTSNLDVYAINTIPGFENIVSDPGSIIYIKKDGDNEYRLQGKGMDTYSLTGYYMKINKSRNVDGAYWAYATYDGVAKYLFEADQPSLGFSYLTSASKNSDNTNRSRDWYIIPVTDKDKQYFGITPDFELGGKYYTTLYASFFCQLSEGMKAYYVKQSNTEVAELAEIESNIIPAEMPVIIECSSDNPANNKISPLISATNRIYQNILIGNYFCNVIRWADDGEEIPNHKNWNTTSYNAKTMRVLGNVDGKLGFVTDNNLKYLPANKAYLPVSEKSLEKIALVDAETYASWVVTNPEDNPDGIQNISTGNQNNIIYTLSGIKINNGQSINSIPSGIYIIDGKKITKRK